MTIYCSNKLESFLGQSKGTDLQSSTWLGDWNGHLFTVDRKKCLIFMNNKTYYSVILTNVYKKDLTDFRQVFGKRLIEQLDNDLGLSESQEIRIRKELNDIFVTSTNNDRRILGTINHHIEQLKYVGYKDGGIEFSDTLKENEILNSTPLGTKNYYFGKELMADLLK
jgi:hypothetical protein